MSEFRSPAETEWQTGLVNVHSAAEIVEVYSEESNMSSTGRPTSTAAEIDVHRSRVAGVTDTVAREPSQFDLIYHAHPSSVPMKIFYANRSSCWIHCELPTSRI